jgi:hypothetical protein
MNLSFLNVESIIATQFYNRNTPETDLVMTYNYVDDGTSFLDVGKKFAVNMIKVNCDRSNNVCTFKQSFGAIT